MKKPKYQVGDWVTRDGNFAFRISSISIHLFADGEQSVTYFDEDGDEACETTIKGRVK